MSPTLHQTLVISLDVLASSRSSWARRSNALDTIEHVLARLCAPGCEASRVAELETFHKLQDGFECNIASCLMHSISAFLPPLQQIANSVDMEKTTAPDAPSISQVIIQSLSILQGVALIHPPSKLFLCKKWCIQIFVDLLAISRHLSCLSPSSSLGNSSMDFAGMLALSTIDALLCVLVDAPGALRVFEGVDGVEAVVKTLKRTGVAREVRIKCLEFLYFYLLDETGEVVSLTKKKKRQTPQFHDDDDEEFATRLPSILNCAESSCSSRSISPELTSPRTPRKHPPHFALLHKDLDFVPMTPQKKLGQGLRLGGGGVKAELGSGTGYSLLVDSSVISASPVKRNCRDAEDSPGGVHVTGKSPPDHRRSIEEKKEILSSLLGNVDTLVEGVAKSGIWGLG